MTDNTLATWEIPTTEMLDEYRRGDKVIALTKWRRMSHTLNDGTRIVPMIKWTRTTGAHYFDMLIQAEDHVPGLDQHIAMAVCEGSYRVQSVRGEQ